jgi:hypothetical protein
MDHKNKKVAHFRQSYQGSQMLDSGRFQEFAMNRPQKDDPGVKEETQKYVSAVGVNPIMKGIAFPGAFIVDRKGRVTSRFFEDFYVERNTVSSLLVRTGVHQASVAATKVSGTHLDLTTYPSDAEIAPGSRFSLVLDVNPGPGIHVYAPGAKGYRAIALNIAPQPGIRVLPVQFPASQTYFFKPLNEHVAVYQKPFTLVQEVILEGTQQAQVALRGKESMTLTGALDYQACDDKECFNPASVPLSWRLTLKSLIRERPNLKK